MTAPAAITPIEFIFLGTGPSNAIPDVTCLTRPNPSCKVCLLATQPAERDSRPPRRSDPRVAEVQMWNKNRRGNTSGIYRYRDATGTIKNILIDCGKTFYASAVQWFVHYNIQQIDAVILTHDHADAVMGLDDLRSWTLHRDGPVQSTIPIYLNHNRRRPHPLPHIPHLRHPNPNNLPPFLINSTLPVTPFPVEHGRKGSDPYYCTAFLLPHLTYISDTNHIPAPVFELVRRSENRVLVLDCLREKDFASHQGYESAIPCAEALGVPRVYFMGFNHECEHGEFEKVLESEEWGKGLREKGVKAEVAFDGLVIQL
ncbi:hypothetical protein BCR33DRAFT_856467 [Rhizoclosmatium globosum]|uniref:Metallo-beta-lactamase domain-containing protein n=1 Tax=Rhizoclosmatium globosum TaxID=329046 RepID=A0A1Y2BDH4_9FUNG|nr:hypothetical protein BCR33DRAFT_856467 [Rhizoclosmatium globosum]|eukprot:ORY32756.1 hypothetical protein BCR33DRAFT_856467 [Rhizoclosmatium globosum]